jgi:putative heme-binding domain-containing protein
MVGESATPQQLDSLLGLAVSLTPSGSPLHPQPPPVAEVLDALIKAGQRGVAPAGITLEKARSLLDLPDAAALSRAALLVGLWKQEPLRERLVKWTSDAATAPSVREAAVQGLVKLGGESSKNFLVTLITQNQDASTRALALAGLSDLAPPLAAKHAADFLAQSKSAAEARPVLEAFLKNKKLPVLLAKELEGRTIPEPIAIEGIRLASSKGLASLIEESLRKAGHIRQMDKPLTAEEMTAIVAKVKQLGDPARGERVYRRQQLLCLTCHAIGGVGGVIGPDMVSLGAASPVDYIIESILNPTAKIKEGHHMTMVTTKDGQVFAGGVAQDGPEELVLRDAGNNLHKIAKSTIAKKEISPVSLMPPGLTASLREDEFLDLVRFLSELGREGPFKTQPNRYIRVWRTMGVMEQVDIDHVRHVGLFALNERAYKYPWEPKLSLVSGDLPLDDLPVPVKMYPWFPRIAQCDLEMPAAGKVKLKLSATKGVLVAVNDAMVQEVTEELTLDLPGGRSIVSFVISRDAGELPAFRVEILDGAAKVVTGM